MLSVYLTVHSIFTIVPWIFPKEQNSMDNLDTIVLKTTSLPLRILFAFTGFFGLSLIPQIFVVHQRHRIWMLRCLPVSLVFSMMFVLATFICRVKNIFPLSQFSWIRLFVFTWTPFLVFVKMCLIFYIDQKRCIHFEQHVD
jgi:hypothetical protein